MAETRRALDELAEESTRSRVSISEAIEARAVPALTVAWHPHLDRVGERVLLFELMAGRGVELSRLAPRFSAVGHEPYPLADRSLSRKPVLVERGAGDSLRLTPPAADYLEVDGGRTGSAAVDVDPARLRRGVTLQLAGRIVLVLHEVVEHGSPAGPDFGLVGGSCAMVRLRREIGRVAPLDIPVLLRGATGTGKELVAEAIHRYGPRPGGPYLAVNMAAVPETLAAAEFFGAAKGAYTGAARSTQGYFRRAAGGTLFLDEIGDIPPELQTLLLRVLESGEIQPVGGVPVPSDVRLVAATDADLDAAIEDGSFRAPLLHRLSSYTLHLPLLAERRQDVGQLLVHFLRRELDRMGRQQMLEQPGDALGGPQSQAILVARLVRYDWPGNVRELRNVARRLAVSLAHGDESLALHDDPALGLQTSRTPTPAAAPEHSPSNTSPSRPPSEISENELLEALRANRFRTRKTARALGISRTSLYVLIDAADSIRKAADLGEDEIRQALEAASGEVDDAAMALEVSAHGLKRRRRELGV